MGKTGLYLKIFVLVMALVGVVFAIRGLTTEKVQGAFEAMGIEPGASSSSLQAGGEALTEGETRRTLCQTRVHAIRFPDSTTVIEFKQGMKMDWVALEGAAAAGEPGENAENKGRSLNYMEIEKWLSLHCQFVAAPAPAPTDEDLQPSNEPKKYVVFEFIDGTRWELFRAGEVFSSAADPKDRFVSADLEKALDDLRGIAGFPVDTNGH